MTLGTILLLDDEKNILTALRRALLLEDYSVEVAGNLALARQQIKSKQFSAFVFDVQLPDGTGLQLLRELREAGDDTPVIMMSGHGTIETAVEATRLGAFTFLEKPIGTEQLLVALRNALKTARLEEENRELRKHSAAMGTMLGSSAPMVTLREQISLAASASASVLILGERGTGKELVARAIHQESKRSDGPYEKLNCAAVPSELIESELFGHEAGAFTGATKARQGKFERTNNGTLFLDEVGDMPLPMQAKLLRVLQEQELERVGGTGIIKINVRVVAATNRDLLAAIEAGEFRADLYDRLNVLPIRVPPLRQRPGDIAPLATHFLKEACERNDRRLKTMTEAAEKALSAYAYPGNVRELRNIVERLVILTPRDEVTDKDVATFLPNAVPQSGTHYRPGVPLKVMIEAVEKQLIESALAYHDGHATNTALDLGLERSHLYKKMKALGVER